LLALRGNGAARLRKGAKEIWAAARAYARIAKSADADAGA